MKPCHTRRQTAAQHGRSCSGGVCVAVFTCLSVLKCAGSRRLQLCSCITCASSPPPPCYIAVSRSCIVMPPHHTTRHQHTLYRRYCLLSRSSLRVSEAQLSAASPETYATMSDDLICVHAAMELGHKVRFWFECSEHWRGYFGPWSDGVATCPLLLFAVFCFC